ncbi:hypothetical protein TWF281_008654 [Arthrobotrys megalospora]
MGLADLPTELLIEIFSYLRVYTDIRRLCQVSRRFQDLATPILYKTVVIRTHHETVIRPQDYWSLVDLEGHRYLHLIQYFGIDSRSCGIPYRRLRRGFDGGVDCITLEVLEKLGRDQLKGLIITDGRLLSDKLLEHIAKNQRCIESFYENKGVRSERDKFPEALKRQKWRKGLVQSLLHGRRGLTDVSISGLTLQDAIPFANLLKDNQDTLVSLQVDLTVFGTEEDPHLRELQKIVDKNGLDRLMKDGGLDMRGPADLTKLKKLSIYWMVLSPLPASPDPVTRRSNPRIAVVDFSNLTFLKLWFCGSDGTKNLVGGRTKSRLKTLWIVDVHNYEGPEEVLQSFQGLKELVLEYPHDPRDLVEPIKNHAATLEKLYWRSVVEHHRYSRGSALQASDPLKDKRSFPGRIRPGKFLPGFGWLDFGEFHRLKELVLGVSNEESLTINFGFPPNLHFFHVLQTQVAPTDVLNYPVRDDVSKFCRKLIPREMKKAPFKYLAMGFRKWFSDWPRIMELYLENMNELKTEDAFVVTNRFALRELGEEELEEFHPYLGHVSEMEEWMSWELRRKYGGSTKTTNFSFLMR